MQQRIGFPAGVPAWIDRLDPDPARLAAFYEALFGWTLEDISDDANAPYLVASLDGRRVAAIGAPRASAPMDGWNTYVACDSVDATAERVRDAGGTLVNAATDLAGAARIATCADPAGTAFGIWQPAAIGGAEVVNSPGTWNFSELNTADVDGAKRFYAAVFGWEVDSVDLGSGDLSLMVRMPGYADFLEQFDPGIRERHASFGAPPGFSECIAWMIPLPEGEASHWSVTFTVHDPDAVVARARELGGAVEVEPYDIGPVRSSIIRDPAGARFAANAFNPG